MYEKAAEYYERDSNATEIDYDLIRSAVEREYPKQSAIILDAISKAESGEGVSVNNILSEFLAARKYVVGQLLASSIINGGSDVEELLIKYESISSGREEKAEDTLVYKGLDLESLGGAVDPSQLIRVLPTELNEHLGGGLLRGHHMLVFARPETGKSLITINMTRGFLEDGLTVVYVGNEDPQEAMRTRVITSLLDKPKVALMEYTNEQIKAMTSEAGGDNFIFVHMSPGTFSQIRGLCKQFRPDVLIVDQIRNIHTGADGLVIGQERAGMEMRNIAAEFNLLAISVAQAGESASDKLVLGLSDIDSSKTGLPASLDVMVGIGVNEEYERRGKRMVSLPKNKPGSCHPFFSITVNEATSRVV